MASSWTASTHVLASDGRWTRCGGCSRRSNESTLAFGAIEEVGPGGHFFAAADTLERYETAFYTPLVSDWRNFEAWEEDGAKTATQRANGIWKQLLADYEKPPIDAAIEEELQAYMAKRKEEISRTSV